MPHRLGFVGIVVLLAGQPTTGQPAIPAERVPWTTSHVVGTPEPPPAYRVERAFPNLAFKNPLHMTNAPGTDRLFVCEQGGQIVSFHDVQSVAQADPFLNVRTVPGCKPGGKSKGFSNLYGLTFHPKFAENRYCYVCYNLEPKDGKAFDGAERVSRFTVSRTDPPVCDPASEVLLVDWPTYPGGHNGGCLCFGPDGYLYISMGDAAAPNPPDPLNTGQDIGDLLACVMRIDVDRADAGKTYAVPKDNPFVSVPGARPEVWAFGLRNPWKMSFDRATGDLWVGDVGWELWEMVYRIRKGGNYGWSIVEGPQSIKPEAKRGPTPILPPALAFPHSEAASITGGYVYRGTKYPDLVGSYICGDWMTRKLWATRFAADDAVLSHREIAQAAQKIVGFAEDNRGELYFVDYAEPGGLYRLVPNEAASKPRQPFPTKLSETGLFAPDHRPAAGVAPFSVNAEQWADHASAERWVALPGNETVRVFDQPKPVPGTAFYQAKVFFPPGGVLAKTLSLELEQGNPTSRRRVETQVLHFDGEDWHGYSYRWNDDESDAVLVPSGGAERAIEVRDPQAPGGRRRQTWHFPSRAECRQCHNPWAGNVLAFTEPQLRRDEQWDALMRIGIVAPGEARRKQKPATPLTDPHDAHADLDGRARSYLHVNCSHCHQMGAGGSVDIDVRAELKPKDTKVFDVRPVQGTFGMTEARILAPGEPFRSVLYYRMAKTGRGRMPHIGSELVDVRGLNLIHDWLAGMPGGKAVPPGLTDASAALALLRSFDDGRLAESERPRLLAEALAQDAVIRDLFERFVPDDQKVQRLGSLIRPETILQKTGDPARGKVLFQSASLQCANCHKVAGVGGEVGPDLSEVAKKSGRVKLLESILDPSKEIDPKFAAYMAETDDGRTFLGLLVSKDAREIVLKDVRGEVIRLSAARVTTLEASKRSLMPEQLLRDLTAQQAADLVAFLESLK